MPLSTFRNIYPWENNKVRNIYPWENNKDMNPLVMGLFWDFNEGSSFQNNP